MKQHLVWLWALIAALSGFLFGFDTAVISGAEQAIQRLWQMNQFAHGLAISAALWGTVLGALLGGIPNDRYGRKPTLLVVGILYTVSALGSALATDPVTFMIFRFIGGIGVGASSIAAPIYISEISPKEERGRLVALFQFNIVLGVLIAYVSNFLLSGVSLSDWRWMLGVVAVPAILYSTAICFVPESPRWLIIKRGRLQEAEAILARINEETSKAVADAVAAEDKTIDLKVFFSARYARPILLAFMLAFFNQMSGINGIIYYAPRIFELAGSSKSAALLATVGVGIVVVVFTFVGMLAIDRFGRRTLVLIGSVGYIVSLFMVSRGFYLGDFALVPFFLFAFIASHAVGQGAVIWVYISEIFPNAARSLGQTVGSGTHWVMAALLTFAMPFFLSAIPVWIIFAIFAGTMVLQLLFALTLMVETRGRSLEELSASLSRVAHPPTD